MPDKNPHVMYFVAILCPPEIEKKVHQYKTWMMEHFGCRVALRSPAHITLVPPFWLNENKEDRLLEILDSFQADIPTVSIRLSDFSHFSNRVIFIRVLHDEHLDNLKQEAVKIFSNDMGEMIKPDDRPFVPHVTIANRDLKPGDFVKAWARFSKMHWEDGFITNEIVLLKLGDMGWKVIGKKNWRVV